MSFRIKIVDEKILRLLDQFPARAHGAVERAFRKGGLRMDRAMNLRFRSNNATLSAGGIAPKDRDFLFSRRGKSRDSFSFEVDRESGGEVAVRLSHYSAGEPHMRAHEYGATIRPKRAKYLTVPMPDNLTGAGDVRYPSARVLFERAEAGDGKAWINKGVIFYQPAGSEKVLALFALRKEVTIPPRLKYRETFEDTVPVIVNDAAEELTREFS